MKKSNKKVQRDKVITIKLKEAELLALQEKAAKHCDNNVSRLVREAIASFKNDN